MTRPILLAFLALAACSQSPQQQEQPQVKPQPQATAAEPTAPAVAPILDAPDATDLHSYAKPHEARVTHVALDLATDFAAKRISGTATLEIQAAPNAKEIVLDDKGLEIQSIADASSGKPLQWKVGTADPILGAPLTIALSGATRIRIAYRSGPDAGALQWLSSAQTAGKKQPFLFSQGESLLN